MFVRQITLQNFRCYESLTLAFPKDRIYLTGENGIGKTDIIEAIYYLTLGRSFRKADNADLIRKGQKEASIFLQYHSEEDDKDHTLSCIIGVNYKVFAYDGEKVSSLSKILGKLLAVYYDPSLVFFFKEDPETRRKFMDEVLSQLSSQYLFAIGRYKKLLKERNVALQQNYDIDVINVLRDELINLSYRIVLERNHLIQKLNKKANYYYSVLFGNTEKTLSLFYRSNCPIVEDQKTYRSKSLEAFENNRSNETLRKVTVIGPHRDDITAQLNKNDLAGYGSQGENRLASLSLKLAVLDEMKEALHNTPILLLDDVTSDLDDTRCRNLLKTIQKENQQVFITGTTIREGIKDNNIIRINSDRHVQEVTPNE